MKKAQQTYFVLGKEPLYPDYVVKSSYGNDSIALIQFLREWNEKSSMGKVVVLYNETQWGASWWPSRVEKAEQFVVECGFIPMRTCSIGMRALVDRHHGWPSSLGRFCTTELKIIPTHNWLAIHDPEARSCDGLRDKKGRKRFAGVMARLH